MNFLDKQINLRDLIHYATSRSRFYEFQHSPFHLDLIFKLFHNRNIMFHSFLGFSLIPINVFVFYNCCHFLLTSTCYLLKKARLYSGRCPLLVKNKPNIVLDVLLGSQTQDFLFFLMFNSPYFWFRFTTWVFVKKDVLIFCVFFNFISPLAKLVLIYLFWVLILRYFVFISR